MKTKFFTAAFFLFAFLNVKAQTAEPISELTPVSPNIGKFTGKVPKHRYVDYNPGKIKFDVKIEPVNPPAGKKAVAVDIRVSGREIVFENIGGAETAREFFYGRISSEDKKTDGFFEEEVTTTATVDELSDATKTKYIFLRKVFELPPGKYRLGVIVRDRSTGAHGVKVVKFQVL